MKRFIIRLFLFILLVLIADRGIGVVLNTASKKVAEGSLGKVNYICDYCNEDLLIFGSSRAEEHYNVQLISDSLHIVSYNCGILGYEIINAYWLLQEIIERGHRPKCIIYDIIADRDLNKMDNHQFLRFLKHRYDDNVSKDIVLAIDSIERYKMYSYLYRHNSTILHYPFYLFNDKPITRNVRGVNVFFNKDLPFDSLKVKEKAIGTDFVFDPAKLLFLEKFIWVCKHNFIKVMLVASPNWYGAGSKELLPVHKICERYNVPIIDFSEDIKYIRRNEYFKDGLHMNKKGADEFTNDLVKIISEKHLLN